MKLPNASRVVKAAEQSKNVSRLVKAMEGWTKPLESFSEKPNGVWGSVAVVKSGGVTLNSNELDIEFTIPFDDDLEANEAEIIVYNLTANTINNLKYRASISVEAGYTGDTGVIFKGFIDRVQTKYENADKITTIKCLDDVSKKSIESLSFAAGTKASYILKTLINKTGIPIAVFKMRRDWTYKDASTVDGDLMENIKKYSEVCGVSTYVNKGKIYSRYIKEGDNIEFTLQESTGLLNSPSSYSEEITAEDYKETVNGYECECLLQHRITAGAIINLKSMAANGTFRVRSGEHIFNPDEAITKIKVF